MSDPVTRLNAALRVTLNPGGLGGDAHCWDLLGLGCQPTNRLSDATNTPREGGAQVVGQVDRGRSSTACSLCSMDSGGPRG